MAGKTYETNIRIGGEVSKSLSSSIKAANGQLGGLTSSLKGIASAAAGIFAGIKIAGTLKDSVDKAIGFESAMADVAKVVDGLKDDTGKTTETYAAMSKELLDMTSYLPMAAEELAQITAAAGQADVAAEDLTKFTETAAKMGVAFDITAEQAGDWMATWRTSFKMSQSEVTALADQINYLSNTSSENAVKLSGVVTRIGSLGEISGVSAAEIAAMAAGMTGVTEEISATGIKNLMKAMNAGEAATDKQCGVLNRLGFSATKMAGRMQTDAKGAILDLLAAFRELPEAERSASLTQYFGSESVAAIAPLLSNLENLESQFFKIGNASDYAGSMELEFASRAATTENKIQLAKNAIDRLQITLGNLMLPIVAEGAIFFGDALNALTGKIPGLISGFKDLVNGFASSLGLDEAYKNLMPKMPAITASAKYFATGFIGGVGKFFKGESLSSAMHDSLIGLKNIFTDVMGRESGDALFAGIQGGIDRVSSFIDVIKTNVGEVAAVFKDSFVTISNAISPVINDIAGAFGNMKSDELNVFSTVFGGIKDAVIIAAPAVTEFITSIIGAIGKIVPVVTKISSAIADIIKMVVPVLVGIFSEIMDNAGSIIDGLMAFVDALIPVISGVIDTVMRYLPDVMPVFEKLGTAVGNLVARIGQTLKILAPLFASIFNFICQNVIPVAVTVFGNLGRAVCTVIDVIANALPVIATILMAVWQIAEPVLQSIMNGFQFSFGFISSVIASAVEIIGGLANNILTVFNGIIDFVTGVFTGNWEKAWQGVQDIFRGTFDALGGLLKAPLNVVISLINGAIDGINSLNLTIPDWVPMLGGKSFSVSVPKMPMLAKGTDYFSGGMAIVGEQGPELVNMSRGSQVITNSKTQALVDSIKELFSASPLLSRNQSALQFASGLKSDGIGSPKFSIVNKVQVVIQGHAEKKDIEEGVKAGIEKALLMTEAQFEKMMKRYEQRKRRESFA